MGSLPAIEFWHVVMAMFGILGTSVIAHRTTGTPHKLFLIFLSLVFIFLVDPVSSFMLVVYAHFAYYLTNKFPERAGLLRWSAWMSVAALIVFKGIQVYVMEAGALTPIYLIGVSYYVFRITSTMFDTAMRGKMPGGYLDYINYCLFFPLFTGGPVERYGGFGPNNEGFSVNIVIGLKRLMRGMIKKLFIADVILLEVLLYLQDWAGRLPADAGRVSVFTTPEMQNPQVAMFLFGAVSILRAYMDLSAFTDLAVGGSRVYGYTVSENFNKPLRATNLIDFWRRWHMTIAGWAKDYIFSPLMLGTRKIALSIILTMLFMGIWHAPTAAWFAWGIGHGVGMLTFGAWQRTNTRRKLEAFYSKAKIKWLTNIVAWIIHFSYMSVIFIFVSAESFSEAIEIQKIIFGLG